jgi:hypothetical protein
MKLGDKDNERTQPWLERGLIQATRRGLTKKFYKIPASEVERVKREGNYGDLEGKATPALVSA